MIGFRSLLSNPLRHGKLGVYGVGTVETFQVIKLRVRPLGTWPHSGPSLHLNR